MNALNIKPFVIEQIESLGLFLSVSPEYPEEFTEFPACIYQSVHSPRVIDLGGDEVTTSWNFVFDVIGEKGKGSLSNAIQEMHNLFTTLGFSVRVREANTSEYVRCIVECNGTYHNYLHTVQPN